MRKIYFRQKERVYSMFISNKLLGYRLIVFD